jgi:hypothetical protein
MQSRAEKRERVRNTAQKAWQMRGKSPPMFLKNSLWCNAMSERPSSGFSEVALRADINDLADGDWQKTPVVFYSVPALP